MPFIVTTKRPRPSLESGAPDFPASCLDGRRAVATLEEAHDAAREVCICAPGDAEFLGQCIRDAFALPESGGTVGPLPDGTVIEVEPVAWDALARQCGVYAAWTAENGPTRASATRGDVIAAFNARQASA